MHDWKTFQGIFIFRKTLFSQILKKILERNKMKNSTCLSLLKIKVNSKEFYEKIILKKNNSEKIFRLFCFEKKN